MAIINYYKIGEIIADILKTDSRTKKIGNDELVVEVEEPLNAIVDKTPWVGVYLSNWDSPSEDEMVSGGINSVRTFVTFEIWMIVFSFEKQQAAMQRDRLLSAVKEVLKDKNNRRLRGEVLITRFEGGEFDSFRQEKKLKGVGLGYFSRASIRLQVEVKE